MSTHIKDIKGRYEASHGADFSVEYQESAIDLTRFYGGEKNGAMLQITIHNSRECAYAQLTQEQVKELAEVLQNCFDSDKYPSE